MWEMSKYVATTVTRMVMVAMPLEFCAPITVKHVTMAATPMVMVAMPLASGSSVVMDA